MDNKMILLDNAIGKLSEVFEPMRRAAIECDELEITHNIETNGYMIGDACVRLAAVYAGLVMTRDLEKEGAKNEAK